jgi:hypothetical protein
MVSPSDDPSSFAISLGSGAIRHVIDKHVNDPLERPMWLAFLGDTTDLAGRLEPEIEKSRKRPLYVEYDQCDEAGAFLHKTWELVTRPGIVVVVRHSSATSGDVVTAFFPYETYSERPNRRWLAAVRSRIQLYANTFTHGQAQRFIVPPSPDDVFPSTDPVGERRNVCFVSEGRWGFHDIDWEGEPLRVWKAPGAWPEN